MALQAATADKFEQKATKATKSEIFAIRI